MPVCPSCDQPSLDPGAQFCAHCGTALVGVAGAGRAGGARRRRPAVAGRRQGIPVAVALAALTLGVLVAVAMSGGSRRAGGAVAAHRGAVGAPRPTGVAASAPVIAAPAASAVRVATPAHRPPSALGLRVAGHAARYDGRSYSLAYPAGWSVAKRDQRIANYAETMLESRNASAKVTIDHTAGEITDPAIKAAQVEAATSRTPGYNRVAFRRLTIGGRSAVEWVFTLTGARDPRRADIFVNTGHDGFAFLAHGAGWRHASAVARAIAASVDVRG